MPYKDPEKRREAVRKDYRKHRTRRLKACGVYYRRNRDVILQKQAAWWATMDPETKQEKLVQQRKRSRKNYQFRRGKILQKTKLYSKTHPEIRRKSWLRHAYGIGIEEYDEMLKAQGGVCAICNREPKSRRLAVDHNHQPSSRRIRGLLCSDGRKSCNYILGLIEKTPSILRVSGKFAEYAASEGRWPWIVPTKRKNRRKERN